MGQSLSPIRDMVALETARGKVVDVDKCCRNLAPLFPELSAEQIRQEIIRVVCALGGGAAWGMDWDLPAPGQDADDDEATRA